jgi:DNA-binding response OmpR family regulator
MEKSMKGNIAILEDELSLGEGLKTLLNNKNYKCTHFSKYEDLLTANHKQIDLYILDYHISADLSGLDVAKVLRTKGVTNPIIMLTSETNESILVDCFRSANIDDYINKPARINELEVRIEKHLKRIKVNHKIKHNKLTLDLEKACVFIENKEIKVTGNELRIIQCLLENKGKILSRKELLEYINGKSVVVGTRTIDTQIRGIRKKIPQEILNIESRRSFGYGIVD